MEVAGGSEIVEVTRLGGSIRQSLFIISPIVTPPIMLRNVLAFEKIASYISLIAHLTATALFLLCF